VYKYLKGGSEEDGARLFSVVPSDRTKGKSGQEVPFEHQETLFYCEGGETLAQVAQRHCRVSILENTQKPNGHGPEQPQDLRLVAADPALSRGGGSPEVPSLPLEVTSTD